jgi:hypothetical protein
MFYNVYLRVGSSTLFSDLPLLSQNVLDSTHKIALLDAGAKITFEPVIREMGDGTPMVTAEKVSFEAATLRVTKAEYEYLRTNHHNKLNDVLMLDPHDMRLVKSIYRIRLNIQQLAESGDVALIKIDGSMEASSQVIDAIRVEVFFLDDDSYYALIEGRVIDEDGNPVSGATLMTELGEYANSNHVGEFGIIALTSSTEMTITKNGYVFDPVVLDISPGQVYDYTIQEDKD